MATITDLDADTRQAASAFVTRVAGQYDVAGAILFGSRARRSHRSDSDVDIAYDVLLETGIRIQPLPIWEEEWEHPEAYPNPSFLHNIAQDGIRL